MVLWTSGFVLFSLLVNAPSLGPLMQALHLNAATPSQVRGTECVVRGRGSYLQMPVHALPPASVHGDRGGLLDLLGGSTALCTAAC